MNANETEEEKTAREATEKAEAEKAAQGTNDSENGDPSKGKNSNKQNFSPLIEEAKKANAEKKELLDREEKLQERKEKFESDRLLGGRSEAGGEVKKKTKDEIWSEDAKERYAGTGLDPTPDDSPTEFK